MTYRDFTYWLQGYFELEEGGNGLSALQVQKIKDHLQLCFVKETPDRDLDEIQIVSNKVDVRLDGGKILNDIKPDIDGFINIEVDRSLQEYYSHIGHQASC